MVHAYGRTGRDRPGQSFPHLSYYFALTHSNWEAATMWFSESFESLSEGLQNAPWALAAKHRIAIALTGFSTAVNNVGAAGSS